MAKTAFRVRDAAGWAFRKLTLWTSGAESALATSPTLTAGAGAPTSTQPDGSLYLRTDGGPTLYLRVGAAGLAAGGGGTLGIPDGALFQLLGAGTGTGDIVARVGGSPTEGLELVVYEETVSPAAVETNLLNTPAGAVLLSVQANVETLLVAGGTSVTFAVGIAADPDKYGYPGSDTLAQDAKVDTIPDWAVLAASEQMVLTAAATGGTADGDTAFTAGSVRVRAAYLALNSLDNA